METNLIGMPKEKALEAYRAYRKIIKEKRTREDEVLRRGYKYLAQGNKVINVADALRKAGLDGVGRPRIAIARAHWEKCFLKVYHNGGCAFAEDNNQFWRASSRQRCVTFPGGTLESGNPLNNFSAVVPSIPPQFRPTDSLANYHILWDAKWTQEAPDDPLLLKHLGRNVYAVLAVWDLTPLEKSLLV